MKKANLLLLFLPLFGCSIKSETPIAPEKAAMLKEDTVAVASVQVVEKQAGRKPSIGYIYPTKAKSTSPNPMDGEDTLVASVGNYFYTIAPTGEIREENIKDKSVKTYKLKTADWVESAYLYLIEDGLLVYYEVTDGTHGASFVELINRKTGKTRYSTNIDGFNLGKPIIAGEKSYVSSIGFVGKIDLLTGRYDWKHGDLYDGQKYSFNNFDSVFVGGDTVEFISTNHSSNAKDKVIVAERTGKLLKVVK